MKPSSKTENIGMLSDMDGTLLDSESVKEQIFAEVKSHAEEQTGLISPLPKLIHGASVTDALNRWSDELEPQDPKKNQREKFLEIFLTQWQAQQNQMYVDAKVLKFFPDAQDFVKQLNPELSALVSSNPEKRLQQALETLGWTKHFAATVGYDTSGVKAKKPDPSSYQVASKKLGLEPSECCVIEDSLPGLKSGISAGVERAYLIHRETNIDPQLQQFVAENTQRVKVITSLSEVEFTV